MVHKIFLLLFPLFLSLPKEDNIIEWSPTRKLTWADFKGSPDPASNNAALTSSAITVAFEYSNKGLTHTIKCKFNKLLSWGRIRNDYILNHEQGHFNIAEAHARLLHKNLNEYVFNSKTVSDDINKIYAETMKEHVAMQKQYDDVTNHSLDTAQQNLWDKKIDVMLKKLEGYSDYK
jgi:predicted secreted Zn-dependent protease